MNLFRQHAFKKICAATVAAALMLQPLGAYAVTITPTLAEVPIQGLNLVKPNIMYTQDDSGSMDNEILPDFTGYYTSSSNTDIHNEHFCLNQLSQATTPVGRLCGTNRGLWNATNGTYSPVLVIADPPLRSSDFNKIFYNPTVDYNTGVKPDRTAMIYEAAGSEGTWTKVYGTLPTSFSAPSQGLGPYQNYPSAPSANVNLTTGYPDTLWCWKSSPTATEKLTADLPSGNGSVCRRNGYAYPGNTGTNPTPAVTAGYNYPNRSDGVYCSNTLAAFDCPFFVAGPPYYYTISKVQFCDTQDTSASPSLNRGFGKGTCSPNPPDPTLSSRWDKTTYQYVRYGTDLSNAFQPSAFTRVDIKSTGFLVNGAAAANPTTRTYAQEMTNFAKWFAFYRTRLLAQKTAGGLAFSALDQTNSRVGFHTLHENSGLFLNVLPFTTTNKATWFTKFYQVNAGGNTSLPEAMWRIGQLFSNLRPVMGLPSSAADPIDPTTGACQDNYHLLATDGYWNQMLDPTRTVGDLDKTVPASLPGTIKSAYPPNDTFTSGSNFPNGYYEGPVATSDNLADLAMKYFIKDIRTDFANKVPGDSPWQHVTFYGLSIGAEGNIRYTGKGDATDLAGIIAGTSNWPPSPPQPPNLSGSSAVNVVNAGAEAIDDLWHAGVNSRGGYANAKDPQSLAESMVTILAKFTDVAGTATPVGLAGSQLSASNAFGYKTSYENGWWGDVKKYALDVNDSSLPVDVNGNPVNPPVWRAVTQVDAQVAVDPITLVKGWDVNRKIVTINDSTNAAVPFRLGNLSAAQQTSLTAGWGGITPAPTQQAVLDFLRGDRSNEGVGNPNLRQRGDHVLGDFVYSATVPVGPPSLPYDDTGNPGYTSFKSSKASRAPMVYVGANDGMLHAFLNPTDTADTDGGKETWAFIPKVLFSAGDPNDTAHTPASDFKVAALAYRRGGIPLFKHKFYVNATPRIWDIDFTNTNVSNASGPPTSGNDWHTLLVGGLGAGGRAVYALDVTDPVALTDTEATAATKVKWEFNTINAAPNGDPNLGYVFDAPTLVKTYAYGWVALIASGYNNADGKGYLYVLNPKTGALMKKISLPGDGGTAALPTGLSTIRAFVVSRKDAYVTQAYGGDLKGRVWRFDLSKPDPADWPSQAVLFATLKDGTDATAKAQPITSGIRIEVNQSNNVDRYIFVGTGKLLDQPDLSDNTVINSMYVIKDGTVNTPDTPPAGGYTRADLNSVSGTQIAGFTGPPTDRGWYQDGKDGTQKVVTDVFADLNTAVFAFSWPATDSCAPPLSATLFARDLTTGNSVLIPPNGTAVIASADILAGVAGVTLVQGLGTGGSMPVHALITTLSGQVFSYDVRLTSGVISKHRVSWRLINN